MNNQNNNGSQDSEQSVQSLLEGLKGLHVKSLLVTMADDFANDEQAMANFRAALKNAGIEVVDVSGEQE